MSEHLEFIEIFNDDMVELEKKSWKKIMFGIGFGVTSLLLKPTIIIVPVVYTFNKVYKNIKNLKNFRN